MVSLNVSDKTGADDKTKTLELLHTMKVTAAHTNWATRPEDQRFETLEAMLESVESRRIRSREGRGNLSGLTIDVDAEGSGLIVNSSIEPSRPSNWSFGQLASLVGAPASYLRKLPVELAAKNMNHGLKAAVDQRAKLMTIEPESGTLGTLQAATGVDYGRIWDADVIKLAMRIREQSGGKFKNPSAWVGGIAGMGGSTRPSGLYASDSDSFVFMIDGGSLLDVGPRAQINRGFFLSNSEVGKATFKMTAFLFNQVCGNHLIWGYDQQFEVVVRHTKYGPDRFERDAVGQLVNFAKASEGTIVDGVKRAMATKLPEWKEARELNDWANKYAKFSGREIERAVDFARSEEGKIETVWDLVQGFTAYARGFAFVDAKTDLEARAGKLMAAAQ